MIVRILATLFLLSTASALAAAEEYPTLERVDHVLTCMRTNGGQTVDNLYSCSCEIDVIAQELSFDDFNEARTFEIYKRMPGEKGSLFRDNDQAKAIVGKLDVARAHAKKRCFIGRKAPASKAGAGIAPGSALEGRDAAAKPASAAPTAPVAAPK